MSKAMDLEDGAGEAIAAFEKHLPLDTMLCDVSLFMRPTQGGEQEASTSRFQIAERYLTDDNLKVSREVHAILKENWNSCNWFFSRQYAPVHWDTHGGENAFIGMGVVNGLNTAFDRIGGAISGLVTLPCVYMKRYGHCLGLIYGLFVSLFWLVISPVQAALLCLYYVLIGVSNFIRCLFYNLCLCAVFCPNNFFWSTPRDTGMYQKLHRRFQYQR